MSEVETTEKRGATVGDRESTWSPAVAVRPAARKSWHRIVPFLLTLAAVAIASAVYVILDMDQPFGGIFTVSSQPLRHALLHLSEGLTGVDQQ